MGIADSLITNQNEYGFRIYQTVNGFPLHKAGLKMLEDFLIPPQEVFDKKISFSTWVQLNAGKKIKIKVYSLKTRKMREVEIDVNPEGTKGGFLGGSVRMESMVNAEKLLLHVIKVKPNSFSEKVLGLVEKEDYLIALRPQKEEIFSLNRVSDSGLLELFRDKIKDNLGKKCEFYIYNKFKGGRLISCDIDKDDYFELGCDVAYGKLHYFPVVKEEEESGENSNLRDINGETQDI
ncbi:MAG: hypothetical protein MJ252_05065 [archaeon]|nr:hypothetical protein [archaeon]